MSLRLFAAPLLSLAAVSVQAEAPIPPPMKCETGPVQRKFGGTNWVVYSCDDGHSMVVISASGNPASPFYFVLTPQDGTYKIYGEGNGSKAASDAAGAELGKLKQEDLAALLEETKRQPTANH
ncbi:MAG: hypothetical protein WBL74_05725 [Novosphingobium sp.]|uniref:hypothetical protein n=1 Tax=Novosphingobium sp. TaxID=1874826 RepID=UPI003C7B5ABE